MYVYMTPTLLIVNLSLDGRQRCFRLVGGDDNIVVVLGDTIFCDSEVLIVVLNEIGDEERDVAAVVRVAVEGVVGVIL